MPKLSKNVQFGTVVDIYMAKSKIKLCFIVNHCDIYKSTANFLHKIHINISCHSISPNNMT